MATSPISISICDNQASAEGYVMASAAEQLENWLCERHRLDLPEFIADVRSRFATIAFLNNVNVDEDARGQGLGNHMLERFADQAADHGAEAIILLADRSEGQAAGFDLVAWYQGWGFETIPSSSPDPLMIMTPDK